MTIVLSTDVPVIAFMPSWKVPIRQWAVVLPAVRAILQSPHHKSTMKVMPKGFTLIELLVVIAIMAVVGTFTIANYRSFGEDQDLKSASLDIQSQIRTAQTNATTGKKCIPRNDPISPAIEWSNDFFKQDDGDKIRLTCTYKNASGSLIGGYWGAQKYLTLPANIKLVSVDIDGCLNTFSVVPHNEHTGRGSYAGIVFKPISGNITFYSYPSGSVDSGNNCNEESRKTFKVNLKNTKTNSTKQVIIDKGGRVYVQ